MSKLAERIAKRIMTMGNDTKPSDRIALMRMTKRHGERSLGGRNFDSVVSAIDDVLAE